MLRLNDAVCIGNAEEGKIHHFDDAVGIRWAIEACVVLCCGRMCEPREILTPPLLQIISLGLLFTLILLANQTTYFAVDTRP